MHEKVSTWARIALGVMLMSAIEYLFEVEHQSKVYIAGTHEATGKKRYDHHC